MKVNLQGGGSSCLTGPPPALYGLSCLCLAEEEQPLLAEERLAGAVLQIMPQPEGSSSHVCS